MTLEDVRGAFYSTDCISATDSGIASEVPLNLFHVVLTLILAQLVSALRAAWTTRVGVCAFTNKPPLVTTLARSFVRGVEQVAGWACRSCQGQSVLSAPASMIKYWHEREATYVDLISSQSHHQYCYTSTNGKMTLHYVPIGEFITSTNAASANIAASA